MTPATTRRTLTLTALGLALAAGFAAPGVATANDRPTVGIAEFDNSSGHFSWWYHGAGRDLAASLGQELSSSGFTVLGRVEVADAQTAEARSTDSKTAVHADRERRYLIRPVISFYRENRSSRGSRLRFKGVNLHGRSQSAEIAVDFEIIDLADGRTLHRDTVDTRSVGMDVNLGYYQPELSGELSRYQGKPAGKAIAKIVTKLASEIECVLADGRCGR